MSRVSTCVGCDKKIVHAGTRGPLPSRCTECERKRRSSVAKARRASGNESTDDEKRRARARKREYDVQHRPLQIALRWAQNQGLEPRDVTVGTLRKRHGVLFLGWRRRVGEAYRMAPRGERAEAAWMMWCTLIWKNALGHG